MDLRRSPPQYGCQSVETPAAADIILETHAEAGNSLQPRTMSTNDDRAARCPSERCWLRRPPECAHVTFRHPRPLTDRTPRAGRSAFVAGNSIHMWNLGVSPLDFMNHLLVDEQLCRVRILPSHPGIGAFESAERMSPASSPSPCIEFLRVSAGRESLQQDLPAGSTRDTCERILYRGLTIAGFRLAYLHVDRYIRYRRLRPRRDHDQRDDPENDKKRTNRRFHRLLLPTQRCRFPRRLRNPVRHRVNLATATSPPSEPSCSQWARERPACS